jgi:hypothetical protein
MEKFEWKSLEEAVSDGCEQNAHTGTLVGLHASMYVCRRALQYKRRQMVSWFSKLVQLETGLPDFS